MPADHSAQPRSLPNPPAPHLGESWTSYLTRLAPHYRCTPADMGRHLDTTTSSVHITDDQAIRAASILKLDPRQVQAMHLSHYIGAALPETIPADGRGRARWTWLTQPRTCPTCTHEHGWTPLA